MPIRVGGRLTGRLGKFSLGVMNIQTDDEPTTGFRATSFSVVRLRRDVLRRSSVGVMFAGRSVAMGGIGSNEAYWGRWLALVLRQPQHQHVRCQDPDVGAAGGRCELSSPARL